MSFNTSITNILLIAKIQIFSEIIARSHEKYTLFNEKDLPDAIRHFSTCLLSTVCNLAIIEAKESMEGKRKLNTLDRLIEELKEDSKL